MKTAQVDELSPAGRPGAGFATSRIFVSYDRRNVEAVKMLAQELEALGHQVWFDQDLTGGHRWWDSILAQIRECTLFVFALSPESLASEACKTELDYARQLKREILPILMSGEVSVSELPRCLAEIQYVDYRRQDRPTAFALIRTINALPAPAPLPVPLPEPPRAPGWYLGDLRERIDSAAELSLEEQVALVFKLKETIRVGRSTSEACGLLRRLRERDDLRAKVAREIEAALAEADVSTAPRERVSTRTAPPAEPVAAPERSRANRVETEITPEPARDPVWQINIGAGPATGKNATLAAILSVFVPGLGQFYNGEVKKGAVGLVIALVAGAATYGLGWVGASVWYAIDAYKVASASGAAK